MGFAFETVTVNAQYKVIIRANDQDKLFKKIAKTLDVAKSSILYIKRKKTLVRLEPSKDLLNKKPFTRVG